LKPLIYVRIVGPELCAGEQKFQVRSLAPQHLVFLRHGSFSYRDTFAFCVFCRPYQHANIRPSCALVFRWQKERSYFFVNAHIGNLSDNYCRSARAVSRGI